MKYHITHRAYPLHKPVQYTIESPTPLTRLQVVRQAKKLCNLSGYSSWNHKQDDTLTIHVNLDWIDIFPCPPLPDQTATKNPIPKVYSTC